MKSGTIPRSFRANHSCFLVTVLLCAFATSGVAKAESELSATTRDELFELQEMKSIAPLDVGIEWGGAHSQSSDLNSVNLSNGYAFAFRAQTFYSTNLNWVFKTAWESYSGVITKEKTYVRSSMGTSRYLGGPILDFTFAQWDPSYLSFQISGGPQFVDYTVHLDDEDVRMSDHGVTYGGWADAGIRFMTQGRIAFGYHLGMHTFSMKAEETLGKTINNTVTTSTAEVSFAL